MTRHPRATGVVLAGGRASRLGGADKSRLRLTPDPDDTTLRRILDCFAGRFARCVVVAAAGEGRAAPARDDLEVIVAADRVAGCGPIGGLDAGLRAVATPFAFVCGCDMPSLSGPLIDFMMDRLREGRALVPVRAGRPEPLHALYPREALPIVERAVDEGIRMMLDLLARLPVDYLSEADYAGVEEAALSFANINTPEDLERASR